ncbi:MAG: quinone-dependent dihydroorotate dehydrogenase [Ignavibacteria bacterium]|nr:quinone-dependent dihydroorotate dehydrogenase [Ignavibacteria bacterium]
MVYRLVRSILFLFNPEIVHNLVFGILKLFKWAFPLLRPFFSFNEVSNEFTINGLKFRNRLGVAAGLDKDGEVIEFWDAAGFSHVEVGTVTPLPQPGNPKPRLFRLVKDEGIINRMGFNNNGAEALKKNINKAKKKIRKDFIIGVNIGKNKDTPLEKASEDYTKCLETLYEEADYFTVNISSPNTEGLRTLQEEESLNTLLFEIIMKRNEIVKDKKLPEKNIFLKIAPDLNEEEIRKIYETAVNYGLNGIIATNTTITRDNLKTVIEETGGLSGKPVKQMSDSVLKSVSALNQNREDFILIGAGGVFGKSDYKDKMISGADLVQVYTGIIYEGFGITRKILK